jgi:enterochelin esterase-like enzyme
MVLRTLNLLLFFTWSCGSEAQSRFFMDSLFSENLNEMRLLTIYLPDGYNSGGAARYPVIYATDGQLLTESYRKNIDSLIGNQLVKPFVLIGSHSNEKPIGGVEYRNLDYKRMTYNPEFPLTIRFDQHMKFFTEELISDSESKYRISGEAEKRSFFGVSNGADFGVSLAEDHPELIKNFVLFSIFNGKGAVFKWKKKDGMYFYLGYGLKELEHVKKEMEHMENYCLQNNVSRTLVTWSGGHDRKEWESAFIKALIRLNKTNSDKK